MSETSNEKSALTIEEQLLLTTVRITSHLPGGAVSYGTGFYYRFSFDGDRSLQLVVTNKHVLAGAERVTLRMRHIEGELTMISPSFDVTLPVGAGCFITGHPEADVDLAVFGAGPYIEEARKLGKAPHPVWLMPEHLPTPELVSDLLAIESVLMVGYPVGLLDEANSLPIVRSGITATPYLADYQGRREFAVDMACFPGSSGSPVFYYQSGVVRSRKGTNLGASKFALIGLLYSGPYWTTEGKMEMRPSPTSTSVPVVRQMINIGYCVKADRLTEIETILRSALNGLGISPAATS